jgi:predicted DNA-binding transcriptional regulator AlpA
MPKHAAQIALAHKAAKLAEDDRAEARIPADPPSLTNEPAPKGKRRRKANPARGPPVSAEWMPSGEMRLLSKGEILELTSISYVTLWEWMRAGRFPRAVAVGGRNMWHAHEVEAWMRALPRRRLKGDV